jgi:hypothetical protein
MVGDVALGSLVRNLQILPRTFKALAMLKLLISTIALVLSGYTSAQSTQNGPSNEALQSCLLGTNAETWKSMELTRDQTVRVMRIQEACKEECSVAGAKKSANPISSADGSTILGELRNVLTTDQYREWVAYCEGSKPAGKQ